MPFKTLSPTKHDCAFNYIGAQPGGLETRSLKRLPPGSLLTRRPPEGTTFKARVPSRRLMARVDERVAVVHIVCVEKSKVLRARNSSTTLRKTNTESHLLEVTPVIKLWSRLRPSHTYSRSRQLIKLWSTCAVRGGTHAPEPVLPSMECLTPRVYALAV